MSATTLQYVKVFFTERKEGEKIVAALAKAGALPVDGKGKQLYAHDFKSLPLTNIEFIRELLLHTAGLIESTIFHIEGSEEYNVHRNQGGGWVKGVEDARAFRCLLRNGKEVSDFTSDTLKGAVFGAFKGMKMEVPDSIQKALL